MNDYPSAPEDLADVWGSAVRWTFMFGLARCASVARPAVPRLRSPLL